MSFHARHELERGRRFVFHPFLFQLLRGEVAATDILEFTCDENCTDDPDGEHPEPLKELDDLRKDAASIKHLIQQAVQSSPWIDNVESESWVDMVSGGNEDAALCLLIPLLTNLRFLIPPMNATRLHHMVKLIATSSSSLKTQESPALGKLVLISFPAANGNCCGMRLEDVAIYAAIPSLKRVVVSHARSYDLDGDFSGWPADLPLSRASEVYFDRATIIPADARSFAHGFAGPCIMRQWWVEHGSNLPEGRPDVEWDYYEIGSGGLKVDWQGPSGESYTGIASGTRTEVMELRYEDVHGFEYYTEPDAAHSDEMNALLQNDIWDWRKLCDGTV